MKHLIENVLFAHRVDPDRESHEKSNILTGTVQKCSGSANFTVYYKYSLNPTILLVRTLVGASAQNLYS
jgi:hypothetical protein